MLCGVDRLTFRLLLCVAGVNTYEGSSKALRSCSALSLNFRFSAGCSFFHSSPSILLICAFVHSLCSSLILGRCSSENRMKALGGLGLLVVTLVELLVLVVGKDEVSSGIRVSSWSPSEREGILMEKRGSGRRESSSSSGR